MLKVKASRAEKLHLELNAQKEKFEEVEVLRGKVKDWKVRNEQVMEFKAKLEDEVEILRSKAAQYEEVVMENTQLKVQNSTLTGVSVRTFFMSVQSSLVHVYVYSIHTYILTYICIGDYVILAKSSKSVCNSFVGHVCMKYLCMYLHTCKDT